MLKKRGVWFCLILVCNFLFVHTASGDEISELKTQLKVMQQQMLEMQKRINALETERAARIKYPEEMADRLVAIEKKLEDPYPSGLLSLKGGRFELGGELELEFVNTQSDTSISESEPHFQLDKFVLSPRVHLTDEITLDANIEFNQSEACVSAATLSFSDLLFDIQREQLIVENLADLPELYQYFTTHKAFAI